jgi:hypothetical protein
MRRVRLLRSTRKSRTINITTVKTFGIAIPIRNLLARAYKVIE